jgi:UDPglucose--hexose-1-phosphate uridylyltransferase
MDYRYHFKMNELRKDYILDRWVIIAKDRGQRPDQFAKKHVDAKKTDAVCFFCPGSESLTPPEITRIEEKGKWIVRAFPNKYAATTSEYGDFGRGMFLGKAAYGKHEVIVETPDHEKRLSDLSDRHMEKVLDVYIDRIAENRKDRRIKYVMLFKNEGDEAGTSLVHSHSQLVSLSITPPEVLEEVRGVRRYRKEKGRCAFCDIWKKESKGERRIWEDKSAVSFAPFASRFPFEAWVLPKRHVTTPEDMSVSERKSFAKGLMGIIRRLDSSLTHPPYNFYFHISPKGGDLHFHAAICPRIARWAGFELGSGIIINTMPPELAAEHYRS